MNVYIASFMLLLFNAIGVYTPTAAVAAETAENQDIPLTQATASPDRDGAERASMHNDIAIPIRIADASHAEPIWPVMPVIETTGDKLEYEEGAP